MYESSNDRGERERLLQRRESMLSASIENVFSSFRKQGYTAEHRVFSKKWAEAMLSSTAGLILFYEHQSIRESVSSSLLNIDERPHWMILFVFPPACLHTVATAFREKEFAVRRFRSAYDDSMEMHLRIRPTRLGWKKTVVSFDLAA